MLTLLEDLVDLSVLIDVGKTLEFTDGNRSPLLRNGLAQILIQGTELWTQVKVMKESILLITYINKGSIQARA